MFNKIFSFSNWLVGLRKGKTWEFEGAGKFCERLTEDSQDLKSLCWAQCSDLFSQSIKESGERNEGLFVVDLSNQTLHGCSRCVACTLRCAILNFLRQHLFERSSMLDSSGFLVICTQCLPPLCTRCAADYTVSNGSFALGGCGYATDGGNPSAKVCKFQIASCSFLQEGRGEQEGENPSGNATQSHNNFWWLTSSVSHQLFCAFPGS